MRNLLTATALALVFASSAQAQTTELRVHYSIPTIWTQPKKALEAAFEAAHPEIDIVYDGPAESYEDGVQRLLRESVAGNLPDVAFVGLNLWRVLEARDLPVPLDGFLGDDAAREAAGYTPALRSLGRYEGVQHALATSGSTLVMYVNPELVAQAGGSMEDFPTTFDGVIALAAQIDALGDDIDGIWIQPHDWRFQSLLGSHGGRPLTEDESDVAFDDEAGHAAATLFARFASEGGMPSYGTDQARQAFPAGTLGIMLESSSLLARFEQASGENFDIVVKPLPVVAEDTASVYFPTGGSGVVMLTQDEAKQQAAWEFISFVTGPEGQKIIVENTGYAPANGIVLADEAYLGAWYEANPNAKVAHQQVVTYGGPWYAFPGVEGVAVTDLIAASLVEITEGAEPVETVDALAETLRDRLGMK
ncbi:extracellular solute-binding protein [Salinarimonas ramus]|uniref:ABC transporter substrate-binding protein n=1 Tax=Salinarimonas ramus TaxID=690164 RepID=A0A917QE62_9HYPH|nr:extracellular solute-binding protein [Salinarimonas ramus]GGK45534.1 ABC transporter substrate-binding protein [Salinarimonas ramus]